MPSSFPGMDPYLEGPLWSSFHAQFCSEIARRLTPFLGPRFIALVDERLVVDTLEGVSIAARVIQPPAPQPGSTLTELLERPFWNHPCVSRLSWKRSYPCTSSKSETSPIRLS